MCDDDDHWISQVSTTGWHEAIKHAIAQSAGLWSSLAMHGGIQSLVDYITAGGVPADKWNIRVAVYGNDTDAMALCACELLSEEQME